MEFRSSTYFSDKITFSKYRILYILSPDERAFWQSPPQPGALHQRSSRYSAVKQ